MSGQGQQIFVEALGRLAAVVRADVAPRLTALHRFLAAPVRIGVAGRPGVGCRTVAAALTAAGHRVSGDGCADLAVLVIAETLKPEDLAASVGTDLIVLAKADLAGFAAPGPMAVAQRRCTRISVQTGLPTVPLAALPAASAPTLDDAALAVLRRVAATSADLRSPDAFVTAEHPVPSAQRRRLVGTLGLFGIAHAVLQLRAQPGSDVAAVRTALRVASGIEAVDRALRQLGAEVRYRRLTAVLRRLDELAITEAEVAAFLAGDEAVLARMAAATDVVQAAGLTLDDRDPAGSPESEVQLRRARRWRSYAAGPVSALHRNCGADIARGALRLHAATTRLGQR